MKLLPALAIALLVAGPAAPLAYAAPQGPAPKPCKAGPPPKIGPKLVKPGEPKADPADAARNLIKAKEFMAENAKQPGVIKLPSGIQYKIVASGEPDAACATRDDRLRIQYEGKLPDGSVFDTTGSATTILRIDELIPAWKMVLPMMRMGDEWQVFVPPTLGYSDRVVDKIPPNSPLIFKLKIVGIM